MADTMSKPEASDITIPILSVLKNGLTIKTIILNITTPPQPKSTSPTNQDEDAPILIGRHPDCHIVLDHPSISRFHLDLRANLELQRLTVTDHASVHGTWVSGNKIQPNVPVGLAEGDTLRLGASTREYRLHWVPMSRVAELESPLPALLEVDEETHQENMNETWVPPIPSAPPMPASMGPLYAGGSFTSLLETEDIISMRKKLEEERPSICSAVPLLEYAGSPLPVKEENTSFASEAPSERNNVSLPRSEKKAKSSSLLSRRRKSIGFLHVQAETGEARAGMKEDNGTGTGEGREEESLCRTLFDNIKGEEHEVSDLGKENVAHLELQNSSLSAANLNQEEVALHSFKENRMSDVLRFPNSDRLTSGNCVDNDPEEAFASSYKENLTPITSSGRKLKKSFLGLQRSSSNDITMLNEGEEVFASYKENGCPKPDAPISRGCVKDDSEEPFASSYKENLTPTTSSGRKLKKSFLGLQRSSSNDLMVFNGGEEAFVSDKENVTPKISGGTRPKKCFSKSYDRIEREMIRKRVERVPFQSLLENSPSRNNNSSDDAYSSSISQADCSPRQSISENHVKINREEDATFPSAKDNLTHRASGAEKLKKPFSNSRDCIEREMTRKGAERVPFQSLTEKSSFRNSNSVDLNNLADNSSIQHTGHVLAKAGGEMKRWNIVVDTSCFLDEESRRSIELLEGLKGTQLIIPRIVIRELDCMKGREGMFRRTTKASSVLQWIEMCMVRTSWWIHVQSSLEMMPVAATPPASPRPQLNELGTGPSNSKGFSTCVSLMEIVSPTAEDHILDCALLFKKLKNDAQFVLLTNSVTLKIKAMAEGLLCEGPTEFRQSLVNPYSKRFLWANSSPRGSTWSCSDDQLLLPEIYYHQCPVARKVAQPAEGAKGLKLILLHNSHYGKTKSGCEKR